MKVRSESDFLFEPDPDDGKEAYISFAFQHGANVMDLIAWHPSNPGRWRWRIGDSPFLNPDAFERKWPGDAPLQIHRTPLDFLISGAQGIVILDWSATSDIRRLALEDAISGPCDIIERLDAILRRPVRMPRLLRTEAPRAAA
jgi:hypothetical protein